MELLVSVLLLAVTVAAIAQLWSVSRKITERSRDTAEYYAVARRESERDKRWLFKFLFSASGNKAGVTTSNTAGGAIWRTDYDQSGQPLNTEWGYGGTNTNITSLSAAKTSGAFYRAESTYTLVRTGSETIGTRQLGVQKIRVYQWQGSETTPPQVYETTVFYTSPGV